MKRISLIITVLLALFLFVSCSDDASGDAILNVSIKDAPIVISGDADATASVEEVNIVITRVDVVRKGSRAVADEGIKTGSGVFTVAEELSEPVDLLQYQADDASYLLGSIDLDPGDYLQLRLVIDASSSTIKIGSETFALKVPSGDTSGIKIKGSGSNPLFTLSEDDDADLLIDIDLEQSIQIHETESGPDEYILNPVIKEVQFRNQVLEKNKYEYMVNDKLITEPVQ